MTNMTKKINEMKRLDKKINAWASIANLAERIARYADTKRRAYTYEQNSIIGDLSIDMTSIETEMKKQFNRRNFEFEFDL